MTTFFNLVNLIIQKILIQTEIFFNHKGRKIIIVFIVNHKNHSSDKKGIAGLTRNPLQNGTSSLRAVRHERRGNPAPLPPPSPKGEGAANARKTLYSNFKPCSSSPLERVGEVKIVVQTIRLRTDCPYTYVRGIRTQAYGLSVHRRTFFILFIVPIQLSNF